ncbi:MAG TPA: septum formation family protein [Streptosporangiaceae bacterium]|nr:septum formation family protein [Streptosporangiaceae bacterium]
MDPSADDGGGPAMALAQCPGQQADVVDVPQRRAPTDGFAVATLISGILPAVPLTVILGPVALSRIARTGARGRGLAVTGLVLAGLWIVAAAMAVAAIIAQRPAARPVALPQVFSLHTGQCINSGSNGISGVHVLSCGQPHDAEVFATIRVAGQRYPGAVTLRQEAGHGCGSRLSGYLNPQLSATTLTESYVYPDAGAWAAGERTVVCTVRSTAGKLTGSVQGAPG